MIHRNIAIDRCDVLITSLTFPYNLVQASCSQELSSVKLHIVCRSAILNLSKRDSTLLSHKSVTPDKHIHSFALIKMIFANYIFLIKKHSIGKGKLPLS